MNHAFEPSYDEPSLQTVKEELNRRLAKLTDETWAKDLEIENLRRLHASEEAVSMRLKAEMSLHQSKLHDAYHRQNELEEELAAKESEFQNYKEETKRLFKEASLSHRQEMDTTQRTNAALRLQLDEVQGALGEKQSELSRREAELAAKGHELDQAGQMLESLELAIEQKNSEIRSAKEQGEQSLRACQDLTHKNAQQAEAFRMRESQLLGDLAKARTEQAKQEKALQEANEMIAELTAAFETEKSQNVMRMRDFEVAAQKGLQDLQARMEGEFQKQFEVVLAENRKFREMLGVRDHQMEIDRNNLKQWQEQLYFFDQHLRQTKDSLKRDRTEILRLAKQLTNELQLARNHAFKEYVQIAENEIARTREQIANTAALSPMKTKLEERLVQLTEQRDSLSAGLEKAQGMIDERIQALGAITKSNNLPV
jgi:chromosome segregation ATPase